MLGCAPRPEREFERYLRREVLARIGGPLVWGLD